MFNFTWTEKCKVAGTIKVKEKVRQPGLLVDIDGNRWNVRGIFGSAGVKDEQQWVQACPEYNLHPYYSDTSTMSFGYVSQTWKPYLIEVV